MKEVMFKAQLQLYIATKACKSANVQIGPILGLLPLTHNP